MWYEHKCEKCEHEQETMCEVDRRNDIDCPVCGTKMVLKISVPGPAVWVCSTGTATDPHGRK